MVEEIGPAPGRAVGRLAGRICLITGAGAGIGRATALRMGDEGALVVATDVDGGSAEETAEAVRERSGAAIALEHDVGDEGSWVVCLEHVATEHGAIAVLVNNAGVALGGPLIDTTLEDWRWVMSVNLDGTFLGLKHGIRAMRARGGSIVNVSSALASVGRPLVGAVSASKAGILSMTRTSALECAARGWRIRVNAVLPGGVDTGIFHGQSWWPDLGADATRETNARREIVDDTPLRRLGEPEEIASAIVFLASDDASFITGAALAADGGFSAQ
jgi:3(or 17)beta-hydroxysteroid dehydrogenase